MRVSSEENQGSTFYFTLPMLKNKVLENSEKKDQEASGKKKEQVMDLTGRKILIAEDDSANYLFIESYLKQTRAEIRWARDGKEALDMFRTDPSLDMILMDLKMPEMNGIEATRTIRETNQKIPVIALTAYAFADDRENSIKAGCNDYLAKPVKIEQLSQILSRYLK